MIGVETLGTNFRMGGAAGVVRIGKDVVACLPQVGNRGRATHAGGSRGASIKRAALVIAASMVAACGGGDSYVQRIYARVAAVEGLPYEAGPHTSGVTGKAGVMLVEIQSMRGCVPQPPGPQTSPPNCSATYAFVPHFTLCGVPIPLQWPFVQVEPAPRPGEQIKIVALPTVRPDGYVVNGPPVVAYTPIDISGGDPTVALNIRRTFSMLNISGDPHRIVIPAVLQAASCHVPAIDWHTKDLESAVAPLRALVQGDGLPHRLPTVDEVIVDETELERCRNAGLYAGSWTGSTLTGDVLAGTVNALLNPTGHLEGAVIVDPIRSSAVYSGAIDFAQDIQALTEDTSLSFARPGMTGWFGTIFGQFAGLAWTGSDGASGSTQVPLNPTFGYWTAMARPGLPFMAVTRYALALPGIDGDGLPTRYGIVVDVDMLNRVGGVAKDLRKGGVAYQLSGQVDGAALSATDISQSGGHSLRIDFITDSTMTRATGTISGLGISALYGASSPLVGCRV